MALYDWNSDGLPTSGTIAAIVGGLVLAAAMVIWKKHMKKKYFRSYGIDETYELETYRHVGRDYGNKKDANLGWEFNLRRYLRKKRNRNQEQYAVCNTYTEWKNHVKEVINNNIINSNDLIHWLYQKRDGAIRALEVEKLVLVPMYITFLSLIIVESGEHSFAAMLMLFLLLAGIIICFFVGCFFKAFVKVSFYKDFIKIIEEELVNGRV